jgi:hypothetical protein
MNKQVRKLSVLMLVLFLSVTAAFSQVTTSGISGRVVSENNETLPGAAVVAVHLPSGTQYGTITNTEGIFSIQGMRPGGPYKISVSFVGYSTYSVENVNLSLGTTASLAIPLKTETVEVDEVIITGRRSAVFSSGRTGAATSINREAMSSLPTISRSINDFTRLTPQASGRSFVGQDARFNNITIDGSIFNNSFGLADQPGGRTGSAPISLDAIEEIQVNIAPYDVRQAGFVGAGVNAITRSGTNEFTGSAFYTNRNESLLGNKAYGKSVNSDNFRVNQYGASLGGPIIKNKLFFFANVEFERDARPGTEFIANDGTQTVGGNVTRVLRSDLDNLSKFLMEKFNYETGPYEGYNNEAMSNKALLKIDYNISDNHKFSIRYNWLDSKTDILASNSSSLGFGNRRSNTTALNYQNTNYIQYEKIHSIIGELNSTFGKLSNNLILGYTYQNEDRGSRGDFFPLVEIQNATTTYISFGFEPFTPNNKLKYTTFQLQNNLSYLTGKHLLTGGFNIERFDFENLFFPGSQSVYVFNSLNDFYTDANAYLANPSRTTSDVTLRRFQLRYSALPDGVEPVQPTKVTYAGAYFQDQFTLNDNIKITAGIRFDIPFFEETGYANETVKGQTFRNRDGSGYTINTAKLPDPNVLFSPRFGFNYDVTGDRAVQIRGGTGIFTGRPAFVWISNQIGNNGVLTGFDQVDNTRNRPFNPDPKTYIPANPSLPSSYELAITDPDFKFPQIWRSNIATDIRIPFDLIGTVEYVYSKEVNGIGYFNANLPEPTKKLEGADQRPVYTSTRINSNVVNAITLDNSNNGFSHSFAVSLEKPLTKGFFGKAAYAFGISKNTVDPGSIASGSYNNNPISFDPNNAPLAFSSNDQRHRAILALSYRKEYANFGSSQIGIFMEGRNQGRFSYIASSDINLDGNRNDLIYVSKDPSEMIFQNYTPTGASSVYTAEQQSADWEAFIKQDAYLSSIRGKYSERNGAILPWVWRADLNFTQEFFVNAGGKRNSIQLIANVLNIGNLFNDKWGVGYVVNSTQPLNYRQLDPTGKPVYRLNTLGVVNGEIIKITETLSRRASTSDVWVAQIGIRYIFN